VEWIGGAGSAWLVGIPGRSFKRKGPPQATLDFLRDLKNQKTPGFLGENRKNGPKTDENAGFFE
jgi:hypothetical protein